MRPFNVACFTVNHVPSVSQQPQKKGLSPMIVKQIKHVKGVSCVD